MKHTTKRWGRGALAFLLSASMMTGGVPAQAFAEAIPPQGEETVEPVEVEKNTANGNENQDVQIQSANEPELVVQGSDEPASEPALTTQDAVTDNYDAIVGNEGFTGVDEAFNYLFGNPDKAELTLKLLKDVTIRNPKTMDVYQSEQPARTRYVDLNGHTITFSGDANYETGAGCYVINSQCGNLVIRDSSGTGNGKIIGAGIAVYGYYDQSLTRQKTSSLTMESGVIQDAKQYGVKVDSYGSFTMVDGTIADSGVYGVRVFRDNSNADGKPTFTQKGGTIAGTKGTEDQEQGLVCGDGVYVSHGNYTLQGGTVTGNAANGVYVDTGGNFTQKGGAITGNKGFKQQIDESHFRLIGGNGVYVQNGSFTQIGGTIEQSGADGVHAGTDSTVTQGQSGTIADNGRYGVRVDGIANTEQRDVAISGTVKGNALTGVFAEGDSGGNVAMIISGATIIDNGKGVPSPTKDDPDKVTLPENGGGVYAGAYANLTLVDSTIAGNKANNGAGVYVETASGTSETSITMRGNKIGAPIKTSQGSAGGQGATGQTEEADKPTGNVATGNGGGVYVLSGNSGDYIELNGNTIAGNEATNGAGVYATGVKGGTPQSPSISTIILIKNTIAQNTAQEATDNALQTQDDEEVGHGGGVYISGCMVYTNADNAQSKDTISENKATDGAGVYVANGVFYGLGNADITKNAATGNGGGFYVAGSNDPEASITEGAIVGENIAVAYNSAANGGGVYIASGTAKLQGNITGNTASEQGGGVHHASASGVFEVAGKANVSGNKIQAAGSSEVVTQSDGATEEKTFNDVYLGPKQGGGVNVITVTGELDTNSDIYVTVNQDKLPTKDNPGDVLITTGYKAKNNNTPFPHFQCNAKHQDVYVGWNKNTQGTTDNTEAALKLHVHDEDTPWSYEERAVEGSKRNEKVVDAWCVSEESIAQDACSVTEKDPLTLKISAKDATYDGKEYDAEKSEVTVEATYQGKAFDEWGLEKGSEIGLSVPVVEYYQGETKLDAAPKDAGTYTAKAVVTQTLQSSSTETRTFSATCDFTISPAPLTVTAKDKAVNFGDAPANDGVNYDGLVNGETEKVLSGTLAYDYAGYKAGSPAGSYKITPSGLTSNNYAITFKPGTLTVNGPKEVTTTYSAHVQGIGDTDPVHNGAESGTTGSSKRVESIKASIENQPYAGDIEYRGHVQGIGWEASWAKNGALSGTTGQSKRVEAIQMRLTGDMEKNYDVFYRVHAQTFGWLGWAKNGEPAGTSAMSKRVEAYEVVVLKKGEVPEGYDAAKAAFVSTPDGRAHVQGLGWVGRSGMSFGTTGSSRRVEAFGLRLSGLPWGGKISYRSHVQGIGWQGWRSDGRLSGTTGQSKRVEAVRISLSGEASKHLSVWYRAHSQTYGWLGWARDGASAGTAGLSRRVEAVEVQLLPKGATPAGYDASKAAYKTR